MRRTRAGDRFQRALPMQTSPVESGVVRAVRILEKRKAIHLDVELAPEGSMVQARLMMPYLGGGLGAVALPRIEDEVIVLFPGGDRRAGVVLWGPYNGVDTVPEGEAADLILIEGRDGDSLRVHLRGGASIEIDRALDTTVHESEERLVDGNRTTKIGGSDAELIGGDRSLQVEGSESRDIGGNADQAIAGNASRSVMGAETESVLGARTTSAGAWTILVSGAVTVNAAAVNVNAASIALNGSAAVITAGGATFNVPVVFTAGTAGDQT